MSRQTSRLVRQSSSVVVRLAEQIRQEIENKKQASKTLEKTGEPVKKGQDKVKSAIDSSEKFRDMEEHKITLAELYRAMDVEDPEQGLTAQRAKTRYDLEGPNTLTEKKPTPWYIIYWHNITNMFALMLWAGAILCFIVYGINPSDPTTLYTAIVILVVIFGVGSASFYQEMKSRSIMASFKDFTPPMCQVLRDGAVSSLAAARLVRGDIVLLKAGDKIPADIRIIQATDVKVDNSSLTGESEPQVRKVECTHPENPFETQNLAFYGTTMLDGNCRGIVVFTGNSTFMGRIANLAGSAASDMTTLQKEINIFIKLNTVISLIFGAIFLAIGIYLTRQVVATLIFVVGILVAFVPEGLMTSVTVVVTLSAKRMKDKNVLVKNLQSVETLGSTSCICSDKTGTLTENKMTVVHLWYDGKVVEADNIQRVSKEKIKYDLEAPSFQMFQRCACLCSDSVFDRGIPASVGLKPGEMKRMSPEQQAIALQEKKEAYIRELDAKMWYERPTTGNASEGALVKFFQPIKDIVQFRSEQRLAEHDNEKIAIPFNSTNKYQLSLHVPAPWQPRPHEKDHILFMKGAPEKIWALSNRILRNGVEEPKTAEWQKLYDDANLYLGNMGERVLGFAYLYLPATDYPLDYPWKANPANFPMKDLTFIGLVALEDPPRKGVHDAVKECQEAHIKVVMVTGDQPVTAAAIARKCGIITGKTANELAKARGCNYEDCLDEVDAVVIHGDDLAKATAEDDTLPDDMKGVRMQRWMAKKEVVFARTTPAQKLIIVEGHQKLGHIVAVTGDGVNDSPAIKKADIGIAMNLVGSDVAKDSADMLLLDDNFCSIVDGVEEGRLMFENLKKTIIYALVANMPELIPVLSYMLLGFPTPLTTIFMLLISVVTDILPAVSYAYEKKELDIMKRMPRNADIDHLVTWRLMFHGYAILGIWEALAGMYAYFNVMYDYGYKVDTLFGLAMATGCQPADGDIYNPNLPNKGNSHAGNTTFEGSSPDWLSVSNPKADLRVWFYKFDTSAWSECQYPGFESSVHSGARYCYSTEALVAAQGAFFCAVVTMQWVDVIINKTRYLNIWLQGLNNRVTWAGFVLETLAALAVVYIPGLNMGIGARPLMPLHIFVPAMPWCMTMFFFDETRKFYDRMYRDRFHRLSSIEKTTQY